MLASIVTSFEAVLKMLSVNIHGKSQFQSNDLPKASKYIKMASKLSSTVTTLANIALAGEYTHSLHKPFVHDSFAAIIQEVLAIFKKVKMFISQKRNV